MLLLQSEKIKAGLIVLGDVVTASGDKAVETPTAKPQSNTSSALGTYMITASDLKVRTGPGMK